MDNNRSSPITRTRPQKDVLRSGWPHRQTLEVRIVSWWDGKIFASVDNLSRMNYFLILRIYFFDLRFKLFFLSCFVVFPGLMDILIIRNIKIYLRLGQEFHLPAYAIRRERSISDQSTIGWRLTVSPFLSRAHHGQHCPLPSPVYRQHERTAVPPLSTWLARHRQTASTC